MVVISYTTGCLNCRSVLHLTFVRWAHQRAALPSQCWAKGWSMRRTTHHPLYSGPCHSLPVPYYRGLGFTFKTMPWVMSMVLCDQLARTVGGQACPWINHEGGGKRPNLPDCAIVALTVETPAWLFGRELIILRTKETLDNFIGYMWGSSVLLLFIINGESYNGLVLTPAFIINFILFSSFIHRTGVSSHGSTSWYYVQRTQVQVSV